MKPVVRHISLPFTFYIPDNKMISPEKTVILWRRFLRHSRIRLSQDLGNRSSRLYAGSLHDVARIMSMIQREGNP